jgi:hypothetical protein
MPEPPIFLTTLETHGLQLTALMEDLENTFPHVNPRPSDTHAEIIYRAGQRSVVNYIQRRIDPDDG